MAHPLSRYKYHGKIVFTIAKIIFFPYYKIAYTWPAWRFINKRSSSFYAKHPVALDQVQRRVADDLKRDGLAFSSVEELGGSLARLQEFTASLTPKESSNSHKLFLLPLLVRPVIDFSNPFVDFLLSERVLKIAAAYMGLAPIFKHLDIQRAKAGVSDGKQGSQNWHRDYDDKKLVKVFIYLNDVDEGAGPFSYVKETHSQGRYANVLPAKPPYGLYPKEEDLFKAIPRANVKLCTGKAGTVVFADTAGYHCGGYAKTSDRTMFTGVLGARTHLLRDEYTYSDAFKKEYTRLGEYGQYAVAKGHSHVH